MGSLLTADSCFSMFDAIGVAMAKLPISPLLNSSNRTIAIQNVRHTAKLVSIFPESTAYVRKV